MVQQADSLVTLLTTSGFNVSSWLVTKLMKQAGLISNQLPTHKYAKGEKEKRRKGEKEHLCILNVLARNFSPMLQIRYDAVM